MNNKIVRDKEYFVYTRISKDVDDKNGYKGSLENQVEMCEKLAKDLGIKTSQLIHKQEDISSFKAGNRPEFNAMIKELMEDFSEHSKPEQIDKRKYGGIIFFKVDRLARNYKDFEAVDKLLNGGYELLSATETIENTPTGRLLLRILAGFAIYESEKLSNRMSLAQLHSLLKQNFSSLGGQTSVFGYTVTNKKDQLEKDNDLDRIEPDKKEASMIFDMYQIFLETNRNRISPDYATTTKIINEKYNSSLTKARVRNIIINDGQIKYNGIIQRHISINDRIVRNYISRILCNDDIEMELEGTNIIGGKMLFKFHIEEYQIMPNSLYTNVQNLLSSIGKKQTERLGDIYSTIYDVAKFYDEDINKYFSFPKPETTKNKEGNIYVSHRFKSGYPSKSEKKILAPFFKSQLCKRLVKVNGYEELIKGQLEKIMKSKSDKQRRKMNAELMWRERQYNRLEELRDSDGFIYGTGFLVELDALHQDISSLRRDINELSTFNHNQVRTMIDILTVTNIGKQSRDLQKSYFALFFDTIAIDIHMKKVWFYPRQIFLELLSLKKSHEWKI